MESRYTSKSGFVQYCLFRCRCGAWLAFLWQSPAIIIDVSGCRLVLFVARRRIPMVCVSVAIVCWLHDVWCWLGVCCMHVLLFMLFHMLWLWLLGRFFILCWFRVFYVEDLFVGEPFCLVVSLF